MSPSAESRGRARRDEGFSLIEIIVALGIFSIVLVALLPQLIVGIRATGTARVVSQAKGIGQGQLERMRHLPFHIAPAAGDYVDVLDYYYPDLDTPGTTPTCKTGTAYNLPTTGWSGFVAAGTAARCDYEPATGAFHRTVEVVAAQSGITGFTVVVDTQFLSGATPPVPVSPLSGYDTRTVGRDNPASSQIGVTVTVLYDRRGTLRPVSHYTQIAERLSTTSRVRSEADVRVLDVGSVTADKVPLTFSAGLLNLTGSVSYASTVNANLAVTSAGLATGEQGSGASRTLEAPPSLTTTASSEPAGVLSVGGCSYACWGGTSLPGFAMSAENGLPTAGTEALPAQVLLSDVTNEGLSFGNSIAGYRPALDLSPPLVRMDPSVSSGPSGLASGCAVGATGTSSYLSASGYLNTTDTNLTGEVDSCAVARAKPVELFPTSFAPHGVVRIELERASARCRVQGAGHAASTSYDYSAVVKYFNGTDYTTAATVIPGLTTDPLESVPLTTAVGGGHTLGDYISSWSSLTGDKVVDVHSAGVAQVNLPGIVNIASTPVRPDAAAESGLDDNSVVSLTLGALSCRAEDAR